MVCKITVEANIELQKGKKIETLKQDREVLNRKALQS